MEGTLSPRCGRCHEHITWKKCDFRREDGYPDWVLAVYCGCGLVTDPEIRRAARADYDAQLARQIQAEQEENLRKACPGWAGRLES